MYPHVRYCYSKYLKKKKKDKTKWFTRDSVEISILKVAFNKIISLSVLDILRFIYTHSNINLHLYYSA